MQILTKKLKQTPISRAFKNKPGIAFDKTKKLCDQRFKMLRIFILKQLKAKRKYDFKMQMLTKYRQALILGLDTI